MSLFPMEQPNPALERLRELVLDEMTPREALTALYGLQELAGER